MNHLNLFFLALCAVLLTAVPATAQTDQIVPRQPQADVIENVVMTSAQCRQIIELEELFFSEGNSTAENPYVLEDVAEILRACPQTSYIISPRLSEVELRSVNAQQLARDRAEFVRNELYKLGVRNCNVDVNVDEPVTGFLEPEDAKIAKDREGFQFEHARQRRVDLIPQTCAREDCDLVMVRPALVAERRQPRPTPPPPAPKPQEAKEVAPWYNNFGGGVQFGYGGLKSLAYDAVGIGYAETCGGELGAYPASAGQCNTEFAEELLSVEVNLTYDLLDHFANSEISAGPSVGIGGTRTESVRDGIGRTHVSFSLGGQVGVETLPDVDFTIGAGYRHVTSLYYAAPTGGPYVQVGATFFPWRQ
jgi:hypothetical protein